MHRDGSFKDQNQSRSEPTPWKDSFVKFCNKILYSLPRQQNYQYASNLDRLKKQLSYVRTVIQPFLSSKVPRQDITTSLKKIRSLNCGLKTRRNVKKLLKMTGIGQRQFTR